MQISGVQAYSLFGLILGIFLPLAIFGRILIDTKGMRTEDLWILGIVALVNLITATVGFISGKLIGKITLEVEKYSWTKMLLLLPLIGIFWGIMAGGAGGVIVLIIRSVYRSIYRRNCRKCRFASFCNCSSVTHKRQFN